MHRSPYDGATVQCEDEMNESMGLLGRKVGMTQIFNTDGTVLPVTVVETGPCTVLQVKTAAGNDGYNAIQLGFDSKRDSITTKADRGHAKKAGGEEAKVSRFIAEIRVSADAAAAHTAGQQLTAGQVFKVGERVDVIGTSKGRGFGGVMRSHHFKGFERGHGAHEYFRHGGSIGTRLTPGMTLAGKKMPGQLGNARTTVQRIEVVRIDEARNLVFIRGGVPGPDGGFVTLRQSVKD
jgi:large subunit ribosomal protein L3